MRRNLTISFDEGFICGMDEDRGKTSRGRWLESGRLANVTFPADPDEPEPRGAVPSDEDVPLRELVRATMGRPHTARQASAYGMVAQPRPIVQKRAK